MEFDDCVIGMPIKRSKFLGFLEAGDFCIIIDICPMRRMIKVRYCEKKRHPKIGWGLDPDDFIPLTEEEKKRHKDLIIRCGGNV